MVIEASLESGLLRGVPARGSARSPEVWLLVGDRVGDNRQLETLASGLGWPVQRKYLRVKEEVARSKPKVVPTVHHLEAGKSDPLEPPWPDLVVTMGRRLSMVALWIARQSGGRTRTVLLGKPSGQLERFDLVVPSAENPLPRQPNVLPIQLPLTRVDGDALARAREEWEPRLADLPRPLTALLVGGPTRPYRFDERAAADLVAGAARSAGEGTLVATTSPRTPAALVAAVERGLPPGARLHRWAPDATENPYLGLLALADRFVVTSDSISMLVEVACLGKPLAIFPLEVERPAAIARLTYWLAARLLSSTAGTKPPGPTEPLGLALYRRGLIRHGRNFGAIHRTLLREGMAVLLGEPLPARSRGAPDELPRVVQRIRALVA